MVILRPSDRELLKKLEEAKKALKTQGGVFANPAKAVGELNNLKLGDTREIWSLILDLLEEIHPKDYKGAKPPQKSYEKAIAGHDLFAFCWQSEKCEEKMYIKFALKNGLYYYVSLHPSHLLKKE